MSKTTRFTFHKGMYFPIQAGELRAKCFNEAEIKRRAQSDPDAQPLTHQQLAKFQRVKFLAKRK